MESIQKRAPGRERTHNLSRFSSNYGRDWSIVPSVSCIYESFNFDVVSLVNNDDSLICSTRARRTVEVNFLVRQSDVEASKIRL